MKTREERELERRKRNEDILKRMKQGEPLVDNPENTWFPPRPIIQKDKKLMERLYGEKPRRKSPGLKVLK